MRSCKNTLLNIFFGKKIMIAKRFELLHLTIPEDSQLLLVKIRNILNQAP